MATGGGVIPVWRAERARAHATCSPPAATSAPRRRSRSPYAAQRNTGGLERGASRILLRYIQATSLIPPNSLLRFIAGLGSDLNACDRYAPTDSDAHVRSATDPRRP